MLNEEKIRLMTGCAMFEKKTRKDIFPVKRYFKGDYISGNMIRSFLMYVVSSLLCVGLWLLCRIEEVMSMTDITGLFDALKRLGIYFAAGLLIYLFITHWICSRRYDRASRSMKIYQAKLRRLERKYDASSVARSSEEEVR